MHLKNQTQDVSYFSGFCWFSIENHQNTMVFDDFLLLLYEVADDWPGIIPRRFLCDSNVNPWRFQGNSKAQVLGGWM
jgi:hypothetical protein